MVFEKFVGIFPCVLKVCQDVHDLKVLKCFCRSFVGHTGISRLFQGRLGAHLKFQ